MTQTQLAYLAIPQGLSPLKHCSMALIRVESRVVLAHNNQRGSWECCQLLKPSDLLRCRIFHLWIPCGVHSLVELPGKSTCSTQKTSKIVAATSARYSYGSIIFSIYSRKGATLLAQISINFESNRLIVGFQGYEVPIYGAQIHGTSGTKKNWIRSL